MTIDTFDLTRRSLGRDSFALPRQRRSKSSQNAKRSGPLTADAIDPLPLHRGNGDPLRRQPMVEAGSDGPPQLNIDRARREQRRLETTLRQLDRRIMGQRSQDRRSGTTTEFTDTLLERQGLRDQLRRIGTALRPERQQTTPDEVMAKRADLQRQGLNQAQGDLSRATAPIAPDRAAQVRQATEAQAVAAARARQQPGGNVPALELLPSNLNRAAAETLVRQQGGSIDSAVRRVDAFENFGFTPEQAEARATEANAAALRRNTERTDARSALAETFTKRDMEEAEAAERAERIRQAQEAARIAEIRAATRSFDAVQIETPDPIAALRQRAEEVALRQQIAEVEAAMRKLAGPPGQAHDFVERQEGLNSAIEAATPERVANVIGGLAGTIQSVRNNRNEEAETFTPMLSGIDNFMEVIRGWPVDLQAEAASQVLEQLSLAGVGEAGPETLSEGSLGAIAGEVFELSTLLDPLSIGDRLAGRAFATVKSERKIRETLGRLRDIAMQAPTQLPTSAVE